MRSDPQQRFALTEIQPDQSEVEHLKVAKTAVNDPRRRGRRATAEVSLLHQRDAKASQGRVPRDSTSNDAAADYDDIELFVFQRRQSGHVTMILIPILTLDFVTARR
jgi:hypothetical protein